VGANNTHGHPHDSVINRLNAAGIRIYRTDHHGNIIITTDGVELKVESD
jgi:beta-lactamase superfamily II metal-dependent hydrolase